MLTFLDLEQSFYFWVVFHFMACATVVLRLTFKIFPLLCSCKQCCSEHSYVCLLGPCARVFTGGILRIVLAGHRNAYIATKCGHTSGLPPELFLVLQYLVLSEFLTFANMLAVKDVIV